MDIKLFLLLTGCLLALFAGAVPTLGHETTKEQPLIIDTDMGLDDVVTLALALQNPDVRVKAVVGTEGACDGRKCADFLYCLLWEFNRTELMLYEPIVNRKPKKIPPFRSFVEEALDKVLPSIATDDYKNTFAPEAYTVYGSKTNILLLGPLTNLATALRAEPEIKTKIAKIVIAGPPDISRNWNLRYDLEAFEIVRQSGIQMIFVAPDAKLVGKPRTWQSKELNLGSNTSIGEKLFRRLLEQDNVREHYVNQLSFHDELAFLFLANPLLFKPGNREDVRVPTDANAIAKYFTCLLVEGRKSKPRVVFADEQLPKSTLRPDVSKRMDHIIARHSQTEWFAQLVMNELHEHLGAYSIIGVKMGLHAMELLNAPQHGMKVVSHVILRPPVSCLNDGIIVATGCTPGRVLFSQGEVDPSSVKVTFTYNNRTITLELKDQYRNKIQREINNLRRFYSLEDHVYWIGVRNIGLDIWENWHRRELFKIVVAKENPINKKPKD